MLTLKVYGPPGTGKTRKMLELFEVELETVSPQKVGFVTFTRAAKEEALSRASMTEDDLPWVKTLHGICYKLLKIRQDELVTPRDIRNFGKSIGVALSGRMHDPLSLESLTEKQLQQTKADRLLQLNHLGRHRGIKLKEALRDAPMELDFAYSKWFTESYRNWKLSEGKVDYTDLLTEFLRRGPAVELDALFIDEAQDLSFLQWQVVRKLSSTVSRRYLAGDDDQAIFLWAGASAELFNTEPADEVIVLPQSYRISRAIHRTAQTIIHRIKVRQAKEYQPRDSDGEYRPVGYLEPRLLEGNSTLVLFRNHHRGAALAGELESLGIPFGGSYGVLGNDEVQAALSGWVKALQDKPIKVNEARALIGFCAPGYLQEGAKEKAQMRSGEISMPSFFKAEATSSMWMNVLPRLPRIRYIDRVVERYGWEGLMDPKVQLLSIHQAKGREADTVVLDLEMARRTYEQYMKEPDDEHRVYYVAVTRAREKLFTLMPTDPMSYQL